MPTDMHETPRSPFRAELERILRMSDPPMDRGDDYGRGSAAAGTDQALLARVVRTYRKRKGITEPKGKGCIKFKASKYSNAQILAAWKEVGTVAGAARLVGCRPDVVRLRLRDMGERA